MTELKYQFVANRSDIAQGECLRVEAASRELVICHTPEGFFALDNLCSHANSPLDGGRLRGHKLFCPLHGAAFDIRDGSALSRPAVQPVKSYALRVEGDEILVALSE